MPFQTHPDYITVSDFRTWKKIEQKMMKSDTSDEAAKYCDSIKKIQTSPYSFASLEPF